jgi:hypothetical protein
MKVVAFVILAATLTVVFEPNSQFAFNSLILKKFGPIQSIDSVVSFPEKPFLIFVPSTSVGTKNGRSVLTLVKSKGLFALEYANIPVQLGETKGNLVEVVSPKLEANSKIASFKSAVN